MGIVKREYSSLDAAPVVLYAKVNDEDDIAYPVIATPMVLVTGGLVPKGAYAAETEYSVGDSVDYGGSSYVMHVATSAGTLPTDTTFWQVLAEKGDTGAAGAGGGTDTTLSLGDPDSDGSWRMIVSSGTLSIQLKVAGSWVEKGAVTA